MRNKIITPKEAGEIARRNLETIEQLEAAQDSRSAPCSAELYLQFGADESGNVIVMIVARIPEWHLCVQGRTLEEVMDRLKISLESKQND